jgi:hypothetical protein
MATLHRIITAIDSYTLWAFSPQLPLDRRN